MKLALMATCALLTLTACGRAPDGRQNEAAASAPVNSAAISADIDRIARRNQSHPGWSSAFGGSEKDGSSGDTLNDVARQALALSTPTSPPSPSPERLRAANELASILPPIGSGEGSARIEQYEVNIDPPAGASYFGRATISFAGDPPMTVYYLKKPIATQTTSEADGASGISRVTMDLIDMPIGAMAKTSSSGRTPLAFCMALPMSQARSGTCSVSAATIPLLLVTTYPRRNDTTQAYDQGAIDRMIRVFKRLGRSG